MDLKGDIDEMCHSDPMSILIFGGIDGFNIREKQLVGTCI